MKLAVALAAFCWLTRAAAGQEVSLSAEAFPPGAPIPGYCGIRVHASVANRPFRGILRVGTPGLPIAKSALEFPIELAAGMPRDVLVATYRTREGGIDLSLGDASARVDPGPPEPHVLSIGDLAVAERASDLFGIPLPRIVRYPHGVESLHPGAYDGFWGAVEPVYGQPALEGFERRGGVIVDLSKLKDNANIRLESRAVNVPARLAVLVPPSGLAPLSFVGMSNPRVRIALAAATLGILASLLLARRTRTSLAFGACVCLASLGMQLAVSKVEALRIEIEFDAERSLSLDSSGEISLNSWTSRGVTWTRWNGLGYPTGPDGSTAPWQPAEYSEATGVRRTLFASPSAIPDPADPIDDPESLSSSTARALALTARQIVGPRGSVELDRTRGRLVLRFPRPSPAR